MNAASAVDEHGVCVCARRTGRGVGMHPRSIGRALPLPCVKHPEQMQSDRERVTGLGHHRGDGGDNQSLFLPVQCLPKTPECLTKVAAERSLPRWKRCTGLVEEAPFIIQGWPSLSEAGNGEDGAAQLRHPRVSLQSPALPCSLCSAGRSMPRVRCLASPARWPRVTGKVFLAGCFREVFCSPSGT